MNLTDSITVLKGVGPKKAAVLENVGIRDVHDLVCYFPRKYEDRRLETQIRDAEPETDCLVVGIVRSRRYHGSRFSRKAPLSILVEDSTGTMEMLFFNGRYLENLFQPGAGYSFYGRVTRNRDRLQMIHPEFHRQGDPGDIRGILPVYSLTAGLSQKEIRKLTRQALDALEDVPEWLPAPLRQRYHLADARFALMNMHFPENTKYLQMARYRVVFDELFTLETGMHYLRDGVLPRENGIVIDPAPGAEFIRGLSFRLTEGQREAWQAIGEDLSLDRPMNRLIQGDVGSGKTVVAETAMFAAVKAGYQAVMMAPTEILARQHADSVGEDFARYGIRVGLLTGSLKAGQKAAVLDKLASGEIDVLIGTHAVLEPGVRFRDLGLVITDEQHRFGVSQRHLLSEKGKYPNVMIMTATPIPRTLAVILFGNLDVSSIRTMPEGRKKIDTYVIRSEGKRQKMYDFVGERLAEGRQAYVVAPLIEESDTVEAKSAEELYRELSDRFPDFRVGLLHGAMKPEEKSSIMEDFAEGRIRLLVSTVVIEVGINVRNATVMVLENCERFGLAQMHQLRGRVGRGSLKSYCFLVLRGESEIALERAKIMKESSDGFRIAEEDLRLRGPGELFGTRQHGLPERMISDLVRHRDVLEKAGRAAEEILEEDPSLTLPEHEELRIRVRKMFHGLERLEM